MRLSRLSPMLAGIAALMATPPSKHVNQQISYRGRRNGMSHRSRPQSNPLGQQNLYGLRAKDVALNMRRIREHFEARKDPKKAPTDLLAKLQTSLGSQAMHRIRRNGGVA